MPSDSFKRICEDLASAKDYVLTPILGIPICVWCKGQGEPIEPGDDMVVTPRHEESCLFSRARRLLRPSTRRKGK